MLRYADVQTYVKTGLTDLGYGVGDGPAMPAFNPGPATIQALWKKSPNSLLFLTVGNGAGQAKEGLYDRVFITARVIGRQREFDYTETLAYDVDKILLGIQSNTMMGNTLALYVTRTGGAPQLVDYDSSDRYHFQTVYITEAQT